MGRLPEDEKLHFRLMKLLEFRENAAMDRIRRLLFKLYQQHKGRTVAPSGEEIYNVLSEAIPDIQNAAVLAEYIGQIESILSANRQQPRIDFETGVTQNDIESTTVRTLEKYVRMAGTDLDALSQKTNASAMRIAQGITSATEKKLRYLIAENVIQSTLYSGSRNDRTLYAAKQLRPENPQKALPNAETIIRTQMMQILNASAVNGAQSTSRLREKLLGWKYCANGDSRTRESHRHQNGVVAEKNHPFWDIWTPPNGYNCRCFLIPIYDPQKLDGGKRPDMNIRPDTGFEFNPAKVYQ